MNATVRLGLGKLAGRTLSEQVHGAIRLSILAGDLQPGRFMCIEELARDLGVSTTPVREALVRLEADGLVDLQRNKKPVVASITAEEISQIFAIRRLLEPHYAQRLASKINKEPSAAQSTRDLREDICSYLGTVGSSAEEQNLYGEYMELERRLQELLLPVGEGDVSGKVAALVNNYVYRLRIFSQEASKKEKESRIRAVSDEHLRILDVLLDGDVPGIERAIIDHLTHSEERSLAAREHSRERRGVVQRRAT